MPVFFLFLQTRTINHVALISMKTVWKHRKTLVYFCVRRQQFKQNTKQPLYHYRNQTKTPKNKIRKGSRALLVLLGTKVLQFCHKNVTYLLISMTNSLEKSFYYDSGRWKKNRISQSRKYSSAHNLYLCLYHRLHCIRHPLTWSSR